MASYRIEITSSAAREIDRVDSRKLRERIVSRIYELAENPRPAGVKKLAANDDMYRIRQGNFRIIYEIKDDNLLVTVVKVADRKDVYRR